jgi:hypothetical protein
MTHDDAPRATGASGLTGAVLVIGALAVTPRYRAVAAALCLLLGWPLRSRASSADPVPT